jgi:2-polyprenyl-3-methyl-5-hydroxy-6-metoxy-1,4-benzoquinol methylase
MWLKTEQIDCPLCGGKEFDEVVIRSDGFHIVRCGSCNLNFLNPRPVPEDIGKLYRSDYYSNKVCREMAFSGFEASVSNIKYYKPYGFDMLAEQVSLEGKRALDIGCSYGKWVYWMSNAGAEAVGIDLAEQCVRWGKEKLGLDLRQGSISDINEPDSSFDVITMIDLIEHIADIRGFMDNLVRLVRRGGIVFVQTPNFECYYKYRQDWLFLHSGLEHLLYFDTAALDRLFSGYGLSACRDTAVLQTIPCDKQSFLRSCRGLKRKLSAYLLRLPPFCDFVHRCLSVLFAGRCAYKYDTSRKSGAIIIGCYKKM